MAPLVFFYSRSISGVVDGPIPFNRVYYVERRSTEYGWKEEKRSSRKTVGKNDG